MNSLLSFKEYQFNSLGIYIFVNLSMIHTYPTHIDMQNILKRYDARIEIVPMQTKNYYLKCIFKNLSTKFRNTRNKF